MSEVKDTNPKDACGIRKVPYSVIPAPAMAEVGVALLEGALKYGRHNYRVAGVRASVYYDAVCARHLAAWWEGEDIDPDSGLHHITKAIAGLLVLRDSMMRGNWVDDRPPKSPDGWMTALNKRASELIDKYPEPLPAHLATDGVEKTEPWSASTLVEATLHHADRLEEAESAESVKDCLTCGHGIVGEFPPVCAMCCGAEGAGPKYSKWTPRKKDCRSCGHHALIGDETSGVCKVCCTEALLCGKHYSRWTPKCGN